MGPLLNDLQQQPREFQEVFWRMRPNIYKIHEIYSTCPCTNKHPERFGLACHGQQRPNWFWEVFYMPSYLHLANVTENLVIRHCLLLLKGSKLFLPCSSRLKTIQLEDFQDVIERIRSDLESQAQSCFLESYLSGFKNIRKKLLN